MGKPWCWGQLGHEGPTGFQWLQRCPVRERPLRPVTARGPEPSWSRWPSVQLRAGKPRLLGPPATPSLPHPGASWAEPSPPSAQALSGFAVCPPHCLAPDHRHRVTFWSRMGRARHPANSTHVSSFLFLEGIPCVATRAESRAGDNLAFWQLRLSYWAGGGSGQGQR